MWTPRCAVLVLTLLAGLSGRAGGEDPPDPGATVRACMDTWLDERRITERSEATRKAHSLPNFAELWVAEAARRPADGTMRTHLFNATTQVLKGREADARESIRKLLRAEDAGSAKIGCTLADACRLSAGMAKDLTALFDRGKDLAGDAAHAFSFVQDQAALQHLLDIARAKDARFGFALQALSNTHSAAAQPILREVIGDKGSASEFRCTALYGLLLREDAESRAAAWRVLADDDLKLAAAAVHACYNAGLTVDPTLLRKARGRLGDRYHRWIDCLLSLSGDEAGYRECLKRARAEPKEHDRAVDYEWALKSGTASVVDDAKESLALEKSEHVRHRVLRALGSTPHAGAQDVLAGFLSTPVDRWSAVFGLGVRFGREPAERASILELVLPGAPEGLDEMHTFGRCVFEQDTPLPTRIGAVDALAAALDRKDLPAGGRERLREALEAATDREFRRLRDTEADWKAWWAGEKVRRLQAGAATD